MDAEAGKSTATLTVPQENAVRSARSYTVSTMRLAHRLGSVDLVAMTAVERVLRLLFHL